MSQSMCSLVLSVSFCAFCLLLCAAFLLVLQDWDIESSFWLVYWYFYYIYILVYNILYFALVPVVFKTCIIFLVVSTARFLYVLYFKLMYLPCKALSGPVLGAI